MKFITTILTLTCATLISYAQDTRLWATYYGGTGGETNFNITTDNAGNVYLVGVTNSSSGISFGGFQNIYGGGNSDAFLVKFDAAGNRLWATYYGGTGDEHGYNVAVDTTGNIYLAGFTNSTSGIASNGFQNTYNDSTDAFLVKFNSSGNRLWGTYYGGTSTDYGYSVTADVSGNVYLSGNTTSTSAIASGGFHNTYSDSSDAFLVKFNSAGSRIWATYIGGDGGDYGFDIVTDTFGNVFLTGITTSASGITAGGFQNTYGGGNYDAFLVKFDSIGSMLWATYFGGEGDDFCYSVAKDIFGNVYLGGSTGSSSGIAYGGFQNTYAGSYDAFLVKFNTAGNRLWSTYYGSTGTEEGVSGPNVDTDLEGNVFLAGDTYSPSGISSGGFQNSLIGSENEFVVKFDSNGNRICATYYGQSHDENGVAAVDVLGNLYLSGSTESTSGISSGGFQNIIGGSYDVYLVKFTTCLTTQIKEFISSENISVSPNPFSTQTTLQTDNFLKNATLIVYNSFGKPVKQIKNLTGQTMILYRDNLPIGLYFVQLIQDGKIVAVNKLLITD